MPWLQNTSQLQEAWKVKMSNAVLGATLMSGWVPVYSQETIAELEPAMREMGMKSPEA